MTSVIRAPFGVVFLGMPCAPTSHGGTSLLSVLADPLAPVSPSSLGVLVGQRESPPVPAFEPSPKDLVQLLRGDDSNVRILGYEPSVVPLHYPADPFYRVSVDV